MTVLGCKVGREKKKVGRICGEEGVRTLTVGAKVKDCSWSAAVCSLNQGLQARGELRGRL